MTAIQSLATRFGLLAWVLTVWPTPLVADESDPIAFRKTTEYYVLESARKFGVGGWRTFAFRRILEEPYADAVFKDLLERATVAGQLYGLCGLWFTDPDAFYRGFEDYLELDAELEPGDDSGRGGLCGNTSTVPVRDFLFKENRIAIRLDGPQDSVTAWRERTGRSHPDGDRRDIFGGAYPDLLAKPGSTYTDPEGDAALQPIIDALRQGRVPWLQAPPAENDENAEYLYAEAMQRLNGPPPRAVLATLDDERPAVRATTLGALAGSGPFAAAAAERVAGALMDPELRVRWRAAEALSSIGPWAGAAWPVLLAPLEAIGISDDVSMDVSSVLAHDREAGELLYYVLRRRISTATPKELLYLRRLLAHRHARIRLLALEKLEYRVDFVRALLPEVEQALEDSIEEIRVAASRGLLKLASEGGRYPSAETFRLLTKTFENDASEVVRLNAAIGLGELGVEASRALPALTQALHDPSLTVRVASAYARFEIDGVGPASVPALLAHLDGGEVRSPTGRVRPDTTAKILSHLAADDDIAERLGKWLLGDSAGPGRARVLYHLGRSQREEHPRDGRRQLVPTLRKLARQDDLSVALPAADALHDFTGDSRLAVRHWIARHREAMEDGDMYNVVRAFKSLARFGKDAEPATEILIEALGDHSMPNEQQAALGLLRAIGPAASPEAVEAFVELVRVARRSHFDSQLAATAGALGTVAGDTLPMLVDFLDDENPKTREASRTAIRKIVVGLHEEDDGAWGR